MFALFNSLSPELQMRHVLMCGTYLAWRREGEDQFMLYHLPDGGRGFFVELGVDEAQDCFVLLRSFSSSVPLEDYAHYVRLPE
ncbi:MAG: hypothetical protein ACRYG7_45385 [Janthinobacterium lividum]